MRIEVHMSFNGNCAEAFTFYQSVFGGELFMFKYSEAPGNESVDPALNDRIMHATLNIGDTAIMGADAPPQWASTPQGFCISIQIETPEKAQDLWAKLSAGCKSITMPLEPTFWSPMFGMLIDKYDQPWMFNTAADADFVAANTPK